LSKLKDKKEFHFITLILHTNHGIYMRKRTEELLKDMYEYPQFEEESLITVLTDLEKQGVMIELINQNHRQYKHVFTHQIWFMDVYHVIVVDGKLENWVEMDQKEIEKSPMAIAHRKIRNK
ncbi:MAG: hypothetical protein CVV63_04620, partial [Tenericutes bacterium HGW-Tenericutes-8]